MSRLRVSGLYAIETAGVSILCENVRRKPGVLVSDGEHALVVRVDEGGVKSLAKVAQPEKGSECTAQWGLEIAYCCSEPYSEYCYHHRGDVQMSFTL